VGSDEIAIGWPSVGEGEGVDGEGSRRLSNTPRLSKKPRPQVKPKLQPTTPKLPLLKPKFPQVKPKLLYVCTGNAARSVMAAVITRHRSDLFEVKGAGTHVIEGCPMGMRTRESLASLGMSDPTHRSTQLTHYNADWADLIITMAPDHVAYVRRVLPEYAPKTVTLKRFVKEFPAAQTSSPANSSTNGALTRSSQSSSLQNWLQEQVKQMELDKATLETWEEIADPASGELPDFLETLGEINQLVDEFLAQFSGNE